MKHTSATVDHKTSLPLKRIVSVLVQLHHSGANIIQKIMASATKEVLDAAASLQNGNLLNIPPELRLIIYKEVFTTFSTDLEDIFSDESLGHPALLGTCRLIRNEALHSYLHHVCDLLAQTWKQRGLALEQARKAAAQRNNEPFGTQRWTDLFREARGTYGEADAKWILYSGAKSALHAEMTKRQADGYDMRTVRRALCRIT